MDISFPGSACEIREVFGGFINQIWHVRSQRVQVIRAANVQAMAEDLEHFKSHSTAPLPKYLVFCLQRGSMLMGNILSDQIDEIFVKCTR